MESNIVTTAKKSKEVNDDDESEIDISSYLQSQDGARKTDSVSTASSDHFFDEDLVWPDPENVFPRVSGIKPSVLCAELRHMSRGSLGMGAKTRCQTALMVRKTPRPKHLPWNVVIIDSDPPIIEADDVEEYLVHDPLFVEFFNAFLALPSFAEAVLFNIDTGGFEVMTDGKRQLAQQIKEAVRSLNSNEDIYEHVHQHAFIDIPVVPIEDTKGTAQEQIERTFDVMTLNKEKGIVWVKAHRLPSFLESDFYFQYRLAKVISQATIFNEKKEFVVMKIDYTTKPKTKKNLVEVQPPTQEELIMKDMYVSFGDLKGAAKEAWFTQAKRMLHTDCTYTTLLPHASHFGGGDTTFLKQKKKSSVFNSHYFGSYTPGLVGPDQTEPPIQDSYNLKNHTSTKERPFTPRPADRIHAATTMLRAKLSKEADAEEEMTPAGHVVFIWPKQDMQTESVESYLEDKGEREAKFLKRIKEQQIIDQIYSDGSWEEGGTGNIVLKSVDELGAVIVGAVMKKTIGEILSVNEETVLADPAVSCIYPSKDLTCVSVDKLNLCVVLEPTQEEASEMSITTSMVVEEEPNVDESYPDRQPVHVIWNKTLVPPAEDDPDKDSLLDSDEDFEERDEYFRRSKDKWHSLTSIKGIFAFKKFLAGTQGEKYWELWLDIDKGRLIKNEEEKQRYILHMRDKFYKKGSPFELSAENKKKLQLDNIGQWVPEHLFQVQARVLEPLVLYWAPRYLLRHLMPTQPQKYFLYNEMVRSVIMPPSDPHPHTQELLPLGPKSCCLTTRTGPGLGVENNEMHDLKTMPVVGNRRVYGKETLARLLKTRSPRFLNRPRPSAGGQQSQQPQREELPAESATGSSHISPSSSRRNSRVVDAKPRMSPSENTEANETISKESIFKEYGDELEQPEETAEVHMPCPYNRAVDVVLTAKREPGHGSRTSLLPKRTASTPYHKSPAQTPKHHKSASIAKEHQHKHLVSTQRLKGVNYAVKTSGAKTDKCPQVKTKLTRKHDAKETSPYTFYRQDSKESEKSCAKRHHSSQEIELAEQQECEFLNSERLEFLLQVLHHERNSGRAFRKFIEKSKREDWLNSLDFWEQVQDYRKLFYKDKLDLHLITRHARSILAHCIVEGAAQAIGISEDQTTFILDHLIPPYEDLFDRAEENVLKVLFRAFQLYLTQDVENYCEVERAVIQRRLETRNPHILDLQKQGIIKEGPLTPDDPMEGYVDPVCDDSVLQRVPEQFRNWNMEKLALNKLELEYFKQFLIPRFAEMDLKCWMDMEAWRRTPPGNRELRSQRAIEIKKNYLNKKYFFGPNSPATKDGQNAVMEAGGGWGKFLEDKPHHNTILKAQKYVRARLENKHLPFFLASRDFQERHLIDSSNIEEDEDPFIVQRKRTIALMRVLSDGENAFENLIDKKDKLFEDLTYWTARTRSVDSMEDQLAGAHELQTTLSGKSLASMKHPVLPQIGKEATLEAGSTAHSEYKFEQKKSSKSWGSSRTDHHKPRAGSKRISHAHSEKTWHGLEDLEASARRVTDQKPVTYSRWDVMMMRHGTHITPTGLIDDVCFGSSVYSDEERAESRWITVAREVFLLQRALKNPQACSQFSKFVSLSEGFLENDILFWLEADRYKKMVQSGKFELVTLKRKMNAIINCFINSYLPPALQIDIPEEMANDILMRRPNYPPDLLRYAQPEVFRMLLPQWMAFREYHKRLLKEDRVMATLERHRAVAMGKEMKYREKLAQEREMERMYRQQLAELEAERLRRLAEGITLEGDEAVPMTYSQFVLQQQELHRLRSSVTQAPKGTQTIRGIPQYDYQPIEERPGYEDDPDVDENAKHYSLVDYIIYREYLKGNPDLMTPGVQPSSSTQEKP